MRKIKSGLGKDSVQLQDVQVDAYTLANTVNYFRLASARQSGFEFTGIQTLQIYENGKRRVSTSPIYSHKWQPVVGF